MNLNRFKQIIGNIARSTHFEVILNIPVGFNVSQASRFFCKGAQIPSKTIGVMDLKYMGRSAKQAGDVVYEPWTVTVYNDNGYTIRSAIEQWTEIINETTTNHGALLPEEYQRDSQVWQLDNRGNRVKYYNFVNMWPSIQDPIDLNWDNADTPQEYSVTFEYDFWTNEVTI